jgi:hypothetical protein
MTFDLRVIFARENRQRNSWKEADVGVCNSASLGLRHISLTVHLTKVNTVFLSIITRRKNSHGVAVSTKIRIRIVRQIFWI